MTDLRKAAEMALEALERCEYGVISNGRLKNSIEALRQALAQDALRKLAEIDHELGLYIDDVNISQERVDETAKGKREWVGLTDDEIIKCFDSVAFGQVEDDLIINKHVNIFTAIRSIEAKLKEKNT